MTTVLITGASGFVGGHVVREAARRGAALVLMRHRADVGADAEAPGARTVTADLARPTSLRGVCDGVDVLLHCASRIGGTPEANQAVNADGTRALLAEAARAGVRATVYLSTASVYGPGAFRDADPRLRRRDARSPTSRTRAAAEDAVLGAGGTVLRPYLVYGAGDRWVVPGLGRLLRALPATVEGWRSRISVVSATDLARLLVAAALAPAGALTHSVYHAAHPAPVEAAALLRTVATCLALPWPRRDLPLARAQELLADDGPARHALAMLSADHWLDALPLWRETGLAPGPGFLTDFPATPAHWLTGADGTAWAPGHGRPAAG